MHSGRTQQSGFIAECRTLGAKNAPSGFLASYSDSIERDFRVPPIPNLVGQRQTNQAELKGTKIPCLQTTYNKHYFAFWNQTVAVKSEKGLRRLEIIDIYPEKAGGKMATLSHFCASLLYGVFSDFPSDPKRRLHGQTRG